MAYNNIQQKYIEGKFRRPPSWSDPCEPLQPYTRREPCNPIGQCGPCGPYSQCGPCGTGFNSCSPCSPCGTGCAPCGLGNVALDAYRVNGCCGTGCGSGRGVATGCALGIGCGTGGRCDTCINDPLYNNCGVSVGCGIGPNCGTACGIGPNGISSFDIAAGRVNGTVAAGIGYGPLDGINGRIAAGTSCALPYVDPCGLFAPYGITPCGLDNGCGSGQCATPCLPCAPCCQTPCNIPPLDICVCNNGKNCSCKKKKSCGCKCKKEQCCKKERCCKKKDKCCCKKKKECVCINPCPLPCPPPCPPPVPICLEDQDPCFKPWLQFWPWSTVSWRGRYNFSSAPDDIPLAALNVPLANLGVPLGNIGIPTAPFAPVNF